MSMKTDTTDPAVSADSTAEGDQPPASPPAATDAASPASEEREEIGGPAGPEPTRYGDWERKGRCIDF